MTARIFLTTAAAFASLVLSTPASAQAEGPWCLQYNAGRSIAQRCHYRSFEQCLADRFGGAFCSQNPRWLPYWQGRSGWVESATLPKRAKKKRH